jgi:hypothetical protein
VTLRGPLLLALVVAVPIVRALGRAVVVRDRLGRRGWGFAGRGKRFLFAELGNGHGLARIDLLGRPGERRQELRRHEHRNQDRSLHDKTPARGGLYR